ncbi:hypothetical protein ACWDZ4_15005, partial [Streptomyces sp. NPDC003016]
MSAVLGVAVGVGVACGAVVLGGAGCLGSWLGVVGSGRLVWGVAEAGLGVVFGWGVRASADPGVLVLGVLGFEVRPGAVPGAGWFGFGFGVRLSGVPGVRPSVDGVGVLRGGVEGAGFGVETGPVGVGLGMPGVVEGVLGGPCVGLGLVGLVGEEEPLGVVLVPVRVPAVPSVVVGGVGEFGIGELPSGRGPAVDGSAVVGVGAALDWVGMLAARLSMEVLIPPPLGVEDGVPLDAGVGADCGAGADRPALLGEDELLRLSPVLGVLPLVSEEGEGDVLVGVGSSKSDRVGREDGGEEGGFCPVSGAP